MSPAPRRRIDWASVATHGALIVACLAILSPIFWAVSTSLKPASEIFESPHWVPVNVTFQNYLDSILRPQFLRYCLNSVLVVLGAMIVSILIAVHAAYIAARKNFFGKDAMLFLIWATIMVPGVSVIVPLYMIAVDVGIYDTFLVLVLVYSAWLVPTLIWLLRSFVATVPLELEEAAQVDGCSPLRTFYVIVLPLLRPGLGAAAVLVFVTVWNDFLIAFTLTISDDLRLLQVGLHSFVTDAGILWGPMMAATVGSLVPAAILFVALQRSFVQGLSAGAMKG